MSNHLPAWLLLNTLEACVKGFETQHLTKATDDALYTAMRDMSERLPDEAPEPREALSMVRQHANQMLEATKAGNVEAADIEQRAALDGCANLRLAINADKYRDKLN